MQHYVGYHNVEKMGETLLEDNPLQIFTSKSVKSLLNHVVWVIVGEGKETRTYSLGSVFTVTKTGDAVGSGFKYFAGGPGHAFDPPVPIMNADWFPKMFETTGHFGFGLTRVKDEAIIQGLLEMAAQRGVQLPIWRYPEPKSVELADDVKENIREEIRSGQANIYLLAEQYGCSSSQVAGIKAAMNR